MTLVAKTPQIGEFKANLAITRASMRYSQECCTKRKLSRWGNLAALFKITSDKTLLPW